MGTGTNAKDERRRGRILSVGWQGRLIEWRRSVRKSGLRFEPLDVSWEEKAMACGVFKVSGKKSFSQRGVFFKFVPFKTRELIIGVWCVAAPFEWRE